VKTVDFQAKERLLYHVGQEKENKMEEHWMVYSSKELKVVTLLIVTQENPAYVIPFEDDPLAETCTLTGLH
jgi:hypothetical protein